MARIVDPRTEQIGPNSVTIGAKITLERDEAAMEAFASRYPIHRADVEPRVFTRLTENYLELTARFPVRVRTARAVQDELTNRLLPRYRDNGIDIASTTEEVTARSPSTE